MFGHFIKERKKWSKMINQVFGDLPLVSSPVLAWKEEALCVTLCIYENGYTIKIWIDWVYSW